MWRDGTNGTHPHVVQFPHLPVATILNFKFGYLSKIRIFFKILQTKMFKFNDTPGDTWWFSSKWENLFYAAQKHEICLFDETVPYVH